MNAPIIVGSSTEGLERLTRALAAFGPDFNRSFIVVQRLLSGTDHLLVSGLQTRLRLPVRLAETNEECAPAQILVTPGGYQPEFLAGEPPCMRLVKATRGAAVAPRLDTALTSAAQEFGPATRVVMCWGPSGGEDGLTGCANVLAGGGRVVVADVMPHDEAQCILPYASDPRQVIAPGRLAEALRDPERGTPTPPPPTREAAGSRRVLIVDDEALALSVPQRLAERSGWRIDTAVNGAEALNLLRANSYDLLLTDIRMPGVDGLALARAVRTEWPNLPVVVVSGFLDEDAGEQLRALGVRDVLRKPYRISALAAILDKVLAQA